MPEPSASGNCGSAAFKLELYTGLNNYQDYFLCLGGGSCHAYSIISPRSPFLIIKALTLAVSSCLEITTALLLSRLSLQDVRWTWRP